MRFSIALRIARRIAVVTACFTKPVLAIVVYSAWATPTIPLAKAARLCLNQMKSRFVMEIC